jgi:hypothetical protein
MRPYYVKRFSIFPSLPWKCQFFPFDLFEHFGRRHVLLDGFIDAVMFLPGALKNN